MKNTFYFIWKALFVIKIFKFVLDSFGHMAKQELVPDLFLFFKKSFKWGKKASCLQLSFNIFW